MKGERTSANNPVTVEQVTTVTGCTLKQLPDLTRTGAVFIDSLKCTSFKPIDSTSIALGNNRLVVKGPIATCDNTNCRHHTSG